MRVDEIFNPQGIRLEAITHHGDGTGTREVYSLTGAVIFTEEVDWLPVPDPEPPTPEERIAQLETIVSELTGDG